MKIQHGGIIIKDNDPEKAFHSFIKNSSEFFKYLFIKIILNQI